MKAVGYAEMRSSTAAMCMKAKANDVFAPFILRSGRWDLESLKMELSRIHGQRFPQPAALAGADIMSEI
jgi:hypothetical protein